MRPLFIRLTVALITFIIGIAIPSLSRSRRPHNSGHLREVVEISVKPQPGLPQDQRGEKGSALSIVVEVSAPNPQLPSFELRQIRLSRDRTTIIDLDLAESIDGQEVRLKFRGSSNRYRILQRYRTSMSISAEGPHLDLVDWRHFDSPWTPLESIGSMRFRTLRSEQMEDSTFPSTTKAEIIKEVRRRVGKDWPSLLELVNECNGPDDGACLVMISSIYLRIQKQVRSHWIDIGLVEVRIPMGC